MYCNKLISVFLFFLITLVTHPLVAQNTEQKKLEEKRNVLKNEILKIKRYLETTSKKEAGLSSQVQDLNQKIQTRQKLINTMDNEIDNLTFDINRNAKKIKKFEGELTKLKEDYAQMIYRSYKNRSTDNQLLFLLSSESFYQGYLRFQYLKQYSQYRKKQGELIVEQSEKLKILNDSLAAKKQIQETLMADKVGEQGELEKEKQKQQELVKKYQKQKKEYQTQISKKQQEERQLTAQIENLIKSEIKKSIASSTKNSTGKTTSAKNEFVLAPEAKELANQFSANKGKLPWPVEKGIVTVKFGKQPDPMDSKLFIESSGVRIATSSNQTARSIFDGTVMSIQKNPQNGILSVLIQHGNYISVYSNLNNVYVKKGEKVKTKQKLGTIHTDQVSGKTILKFQIWQNDQRLDPALWIDNLL